MNAMKNKKPGAHKAQQKPKVMVAASLDVAVGRRDKAVRNTPALPWWRTLTAEGVVQGLLLFFAATLPLYYDLAVPEVSGDIRWFATEVFAGLCALILVGNAVYKGQGRMSLRWPVLMWVGLGLAIWAAISLIDALNPSRGIVLIKALYAQLLLMVAVYHVATPAFGRKLLWALVLPLGVTSFIGFLQFHQLNDVSFAAVVKDSWLLFWLQPFVWVLDGVAGVVAGWMGYGERQLGLAGLVTTYFLQSAVPGSTFANKNLAGSWTAMMLPIAFYLLLTARRWPAQALASVLLGMGTLFLVYSRARASWVALFCAVMTLMALVVLVPAWRRAVWSHLDKRHVLWLMVPVLILLRWGGATSPVPGAYAIDRTPGQQVAALAGQSWNEIGGRLAYNLNSMVITKDYWLNGVGLGSFYTIYPPYYGKIVVTPWNSYNVMARPQRTHTDLMQAFDEMGIPGGVLYGLLFMGGIAMAFRMAGRAAGGLGGYLVGTGLLGMVTGLAVFLEYQNMVVMPAPWNLVFYSVMAAILAGLVAGAVWRWWQVKDQTQAADDVQLMGLMAGISVLTISINALMDFPMQLPTAPAATLMLLGLITALYVRQNGAAALCGPKVEVRSGRAGPVVLFVVLAAAWGVALWDGVKFREANILLKAGMIRIFSGVNDDSTVAILERAYQVYPYDQRIQEHLGVAYANFNGTLPIGLDTRIAKLEWVLSGDPWGANHMVNLAGLYLQKVQLAQKDGDAAEARAYLDKTEGLFARLQQVADFSHFTWGIGGMVRMMEGRNADAAWMFRRALAIEPGYTPAQAGLQMISGSGQ